MTCIYSGCLLLGSLWLTSASVPQLQSPHITMLYQGFCCFLKKKPADVSLALDAFGPVKACCHARGTRTPGALLLAS